MAGILFFLQSQALAVEVAQVLPVQVKPLVLAADLAVGLLGGKLVDQAVEAWAYQDKEIMVARLVVQVLVVVVVLVVLAAVM
jgi:hypothetical protein